MNVLAGYVNQRASGTRIQVDLFKTQLFARERQVCHLVAKPHFWASVTALPAVPVARKRGHREGARVGSAHIRASPPEAADKMNHAGERLRRCELRRLAAQPRLPARPNPAPQERPAALTSISEYPPGAICPWLTKPAVLLIFGRC